VGAPEALLSSPKQCYWERHGGAGFTVSQRNIMRHKSDTIKWYRETSLVPMTKNKDCQKKNVSPVREQGSPLWVVPRTCAAVGNKNNTPLLRLRILDKVNLALLDLGADVCFIDKS
jgi:hypothetical protein